MWLRKTILLIIILWVVIQADIVMAAENADVTVTATPNIGQAQPPSNFTVTYIDDNCVLAEWTKGFSANETIIRVKYNEAPQSVTDGYGFYSGNGTSANDTAVSIGEYSGTIYYRAWSTNSTGGVSYTYAEGTIEGRLQVTVTDIDMMPFILMLPLVFFAVLAWWKENAVTLLICAGSAIATAFGWFNEYGDSVGLMTSICFMAFCFLCLSFSLKALFKESSHGESEE